MRIRILGCSGGIGAGSRTSAMLIDDDVLIDAGTGIGDLALEDLDPIRHVFLTHAHLDHVAGLPMLVDRVFDKDFVEPLTVYAREETLRAIQDHLFNGVIWPDFAKLPTAARPMLRYQVCSRGGCRQADVAELPQQPHQRRRHPRRSGRGGRLLPGKGHCIAPRRRLQRGWLRGL